jgi:hypothetical protein
MTRTHPPVGGPGTVPERPVMANGRTITTLRPGLRPGSNGTGPDNLDDQAYAVTSDPDGSKVFVTGASKGITSDFDYETVAYPA